MKRIIIHWTAGGHTPTEEDKAHYHLLIDGAGRTHRGKWPISANIAPRKGLYAAHTLNLNTGSIGIALAAMAGAQERPFIPGRAPITPAQVSALVVMIRGLCNESKIKVSRETVLSHAEVPPTLKVKQRGKWDIAWLPGMAAPGDPVKVGDHIRGLVLAEAPPVRPDAPIPAPTAKPKPAPVGGIIAALAALGAALAVGWDKISAWVGL
jgi:hypothetical protein